MIRKCYICGQTKDILLFEKDKSKPFGRRYRCKSCGNKRNREKYNAEYQRNYRIKNREKINKQCSEWRKRNTIKTRAHAKIRLALIRGKIHREPCIKCGLPNASAYHTDYNKPLEVIWLCEIHHREIHRLV